MENAQHQYDRILDVTDKGAVDANKAKLRGRLFPEKETPSADS